MTYQQLASKIERELGKTETDRETWDMVNEFWAYEGDVSTQLLDRVELLESRMFNQHGWER
jgi:hypothetical protein